MSDEIKHIILFSAFRSAPTALAAFDRALQAGSAHDLNLIALSSVIPPQTNIARGSLAEASVGDRLYCVMAEERCAERGSEAWAGLGWASDIDGKGGVFVEAHGKSEDHVHCELQSSLATMMQDRPYFNWGDQEFEVEGGRCENQPVCALVLAGFEVAPWRN